MAIPSDIKELIYIINKSEDSPDKFWFPYHKSTAYWAQNFDQANYTWFTYNGNFQTDSYYTQNNGTYNFKNTKQTVNITSDGNGGYTCQFSWSGNYYQFRSQSTGSTITWYNFIYSNGAITGSSSTHYQRSISFNQTGTLNQIFTELAKKVKNVNIFVDGEDWTDPDAQPSYNWQSVPSISGKNGILSLVTLDSESINDGEPVSGAAVSVFDQAPSNDNNIKNLADTYGGGEESSAVDVTVKYKVTLPPGGSFSTLKIVAKKDSIPEDVSDGDKIVNISANKTKKTVTGLDENSMYYFKIFAEDSNGSTSESDEKHITTSGDEGWVFDYTGQIQTFTAPKTGIYSLETWGAQGGDATDGTNTARGGYGAYAYGEVLLQQGETIYINVGGQNGYGGGGKLDPVPEQYSFIKKVNDIYTRDESNGNNYRFLDFTYFKYRYNGTWGEYPIALDKDDLTYISFQDNFNLLHDDTNSVVYMYYWISDMVTISLANDGSGGYDATYSGINVYTRAEYMGSSDFGTGTQMKFNTDNGNPYGTTYTFEYTPQTQAHFSSLSDALNYVYLHYANINLYVDGVLWVEPE